MFFHFIEPKLIKPIILCNIRKITHTPAFESGVVIVSSGILAYGYKCILDKICEMR